MLGFMSEPARPHPGASTGGNEKSLALRKLPGKVIYPDIVLKWGATDSRELYNWHLDVINGKLERKNGSIVLMADE
jgi:phage tail-like protein